MRTIPLGTTGMQVPTVAVGCMRLNQLSPADAHTFLKTALDLGINYFDHADIYGGGVCEEVFADALPLNADAREKIVVQSKCGIRPGVAYDFSREHILKAVEDSLHRLHTDYLDMLLLHRPDALMEPEEVAEAFNLLEESGKVRHFGVSNMNPMQIQLLQKYVRQPLQVNQLQLSVTNATMISAGLHVNMLEDGALDRDGLVLDFCRLHDITIQPWSPLQYGNFEGCFIGSPSHERVNEVLNRVAERHGLTTAGAAVAWLLRHPAHFQPILGTTSVAHLKEYAAAAQVEITRNEWYAIYMAAGNTLP